MRTYFAAALLALWAVLVALGAGAYLLGLVVCAAVCVLVVQSVERSLNDLHRRHHR